MGPMTLSPAQISQYHTDGLLVLRADEHNLIEPAVLQKWTAEVRDWPRGNGASMPYEEVSVRGERQLMRTEHFVDAHAGFRDLLCGEELAGILKQISNDDMLLFKDKINYKLPSGNGFAAHLDAPAYDHIGKIEHMTANLAVDAATPENGCLEVVLGSHRMNVELAEGGRISEGWERRHEWVPVPLAAGDMLLFGSHLAHRSAANATSASRSSVYATYHARADGEGLRERYYVDRRENFPPDHERVPGKDYGEGWKRYGFAAPFAKDQAPATAASVEQEVH